VGSDLARFSCFLWSYLTVCLVLWSVCLVRVGGMVFGGLYFILHYLYKG
jgi:hypothetical protein